MRVPVRATVSGPALAREMSGIWRFARRDHASGTGQGGYTSCVVSREGARKSNADQHETRLEGFRKASARRCNSWLAVEKVNNRLKSNFEGLETRTVQKSEKSDLVSLQI